MQAAGATLIPVELSDPLSERADDPFQMTIKRNLTHYLSTRTNTHAQTLMLFDACNAEGHGQSTLLAASKVDFDEQTYNQHWSTNQSENAATIDQCLVSHQLDAFVSDVESPAMNVVPLAGYPGIIVPSGIDDDGVPTSIFFFGPRWSDARLPAWVHGYEQLSHARREPAFKP